MKVALSQRTLLAVALANTALTVAAVGAAALSLRRPPPAAKAVAGRAAEVVEAATSGVSNPPASPHPRDPAPRQGDLGEGSTSTSNAAPIDGARAAAAQGVPAADDFEDARPPPGPPPPLAGPDPEPPRAERAPRDRVEFPRAASPWGT